ncbi:MAG: RNA polymerase sigma factor, partial [Acidimicrobiales bacterium]
MGDAIDRADERSRAAALDDDTLVRQAHRGDEEATAELAARHLHPAWRMAMVVTGSADSAAEAVTAGFSSTLAAGEPRADGELGFRARLVAATRHEAVSAHAAKRGSKEPAAGDPILAAFLSLPERSRTALWLAEVEGGTVAQVAPVLALDPGATAGIVARSRSRLGVAGNGAEHRQALRSLIVTMPAGLPEAVVARWLERADRGAVILTAPWSERVVGAAAAAVLAVGL